MSPEYLGLILLATLLIVIFVGFPIAFTLVILAIVVGYVRIGEKVFYLIVFQILPLMKERDPGGRPPCSCSWVTSWSSRG